MKKRIFSILTALCLCLTLLPVMAAAEEAAGTVAVVSSSEELTNALTSVAETVRLGANITITTEDSLTVSRMVTLDLNGYVLEKAGGNSVIKVDSGGSLTIIDSNPTALHCFNVDESTGLWTLADNATENSVTGGVIAGGTGTDGCGGGVSVVGGGEFTMTGGSIAGCAVRASTACVYGGGVYVAEGGEFTMTGGCITDCAAETSAGQALGGGVYVASGGSMTMSDNARISGCTAASSESAGIYLAGTLTSNGGTVENTVTVAPSGKIESGTETKFMAKVSNYGTITGGTFNDSVENNGSITGGTFNGTVTGSGTISLVREVSNDTEFLAALADKTVTTIKLMGSDITVGGNDPLTIDRTVTLVNGGRAPSLYLRLPLTIAKDGALTLEGEVCLYPCDIVEVNGSLTVGAGCQAIFDAGESSLTINKDGIVTTQPAGENTISGLLSLGQSAKLTVNGKVDNQGRLSVSDMENLKKAVAIGGELILYGMTINEDYTLDMKGKLLTIDSFLTFENGANLTVRNASMVKATCVKISGGSYYCPVYAGDENGEIKGGSFYGPVTVRYQGSSEGTTPAYISGGTFYDKLKGAYAETDYSIQGHTVTYMDGENVYAMQVVSGKASAPDTPVKSGYTFAGWYLDENRFDFNTAITGNITLTAKWTRNRSNSSPNYSINVPDKTNNGSVTVSPKSASKGSTVTVTVTPDKGYTLETLTVTDKNGSALELTDKGGGQYTFTMPSGPVTVAATFMDDNTMLNFFVDVPTGAYYYDAVLWAAEGGIAAGTDAVHFSPDASCTRAQLVTFLWRAAGKPVVNYAMNFTDVDGGAYYAEAVRWAASEKIVEGTTATTFAPDAAVTRAQVVTMLCRFAKAQGMDTTQGGMAIREFDDFDAVPTYALEAMDWAVNTGVLKGDNNRLLPQNACTRAQIVTLLWRAYSK